MTDAFTPKDWHNDPGGATPITEAELDRMEAGIESADDRLAALSFNVKDYGAVGNGTTDDATAIQAALTAAAVAGGIVFVPAGTYLINKYLLIGSNVWLVGAGMFVTTIRCGPTFTGGGAAPQGSGFTMLQTTATGRVNVAVTDLTFDGNESINRATLSASGNRLASYLVDMREVTGLRLARIATRNTWTYNIAVLDSSRFIVTECDVESPNTSGVYDQLDGIHIWGSSYGRILGNNVNNGVGADADDALVCRVFPGGDTCHDLVYAGNVARGGPGGHGLQLAGTTVSIYNIIIANNVFWGSNRGIATGFYSASGNAPIQCVTIHGNTFLSCTLGPIAIKIQNDGSWRHIAITDNVIDGWGDVSDQLIYGILVQGGNGSRSVRVSGNMLRNGYGRGISLATAVQDYTVCDNIVDMSGASIAPSCVTLSTSKDGVTSGNVVTGRGTADGVGVYLDSTVAATANSQIITANRVRALNTGIQVTNAAGNNPTNTIVTSNIAQGCTTLTTFGTATVTSANNL